MEKLSVVIRIAFRNLFANRLKTVIVGGIVFFGAFLVVLGSSFLDSVSEGMSKSIVGSAAGNIQVYSSKSRDDLAIFGQMGSDPDMEAIDDFSKLKASLEKVDNVKAVVPMGISGALVTSGNTVDLALAALRDSTRKMKTGDSSPETKTRYDAQKSHIQHIVQVLQEERKNVGAIVDEKSIDKDAVANLARAASPEFWAGFDQDPYANLEFLENKIATQATDADLIYLRYIGTDFDDFKKSFDRMELVDGQFVPEGQHGFMFAKFFYENILKLKTANRLDKIKDRLEDGRFKIATDPDLQRWVKQNVTQTREILLQLDELKAKDLTAKLQKELGSQEASLDKLLSSFFATTDENFKARYDFFYKQMAPLLELYRIRIGDTLTIKAFTKTGYSRSINLKVYGTFQFKGLEKSATSGNLNLMDLDSFRSLYGFMTPEAEKELAELKKKAGTADVKRESAEDELFGEGRQITAEATPGIIDETKEVGAGGQGQSAAQALRAKELEGRVFSKDELAKGAVLNAAVFVKDDRPFTLYQTMKQLEEQAKKDGLEIKAVDWQKASGIIGNFVMMMRMVLYVMVLIIFSVALVIISNALVMATLERVREIGTLRAIGAQKPFILFMLLIEALVVGLVFGGLGAGAGMGLIKAIDIKGIAATTDVMYFFFSGPRLYPFIAPASLAVAFIIVVIVSAVSSFYPAFLAMRVSPLVAMQTED